MPGIPISEATAPLVIAVDAGSSSVRALAYDARARMIEDSERQLMHELATTPDGGSMADADQLFDLIAQCLDHVCGVVGTGDQEIGAVGFSSFWHSLLGLDETGQPRTPVFMWADKRSGPCARRLQTELDQDRIHARTGCVLHSSYWPAKLTWLRAREPETFAAVRHWVSFADYVLLKLHGELVTTFSMASGTGLLDIHRREWDGPLLDHLNVGPGNLPHLVDRVDQIRSPMPAFAERWPVLRATPWLPAIGDGAAANVGARCVDPSAVALTIGTSGAMRVMRNDPEITVPPRAWCYLLDGQHQLYGGALSNGGNIIAWLGDLLEIADIDAMTARAAQVPPDGHGLTILPFLAGERSPSWNDELRGLVHGLTLDTDQSELFRASLEAIVYRFGALYESLATVITPEHTIHANGGAILRSPLWMQIVADTLDHPLIALDPTVEASARGAAICTLETIGAIDGLHQPLETVATYQPDATATATYAAARARQSRLETLIDEFQDTTSAGQEACDATKEQES
jgi:gluconokinase